MRDPARIDRILEAIRLKWKASPDLRLGQLLINAAPRFEDAGYHVEDGELEVALAVDVPAKACNFGVSGCVYTHVCDRSRATHHVPARDRSGGGR